MVSLAWTDALKPGARCWGKGPPGLIGFAWPGPDAEDAVECPSCGSPIGFSQASEAGAVAFCTTCEERSHLGDFPEIYAELGGGD